ncbi:Kynureninase [Psilocybe cubensis]|uniref:Kynureninase n=2 Tax=Psilocybe cubensis TaxID=181762 RepID=A0A8H7Y5Q5_PSICU|nr:Kynureninase [Psilocybe cubensis]KAH9484228.1 Kynureninase [Psilocybe cubensis]
MSANQVLYTPLTDAFDIPTNKDVDASAIPDPQSKCTYLCGNSLGLLPKPASDLVQQELRVWATRAVIGHFSHPYDRPWTKCTDEVNILLAELIGADESEVACMGTLTSNLHLMMDSFYKPTSTRFKILCEAHAFPSDQYAFQSQVLAHGLDPSTAIIELSPRQGEYTLREEDILETIEKEGDSIALVLFSGIQYYTGQWFPMQSITKKAQDKGCICGWDLAHAVGNVPLELHNWNVDFAAFCTYKYVNSGPGGIAGLFIHNKWHETERPKFAGWWGHELSTRFAMPPTFSPIKGAQGFQQSNPSALAVAALLGSLRVFKAAGMMQPIRARSLELTGALEALLKRSKYYIDATQAQAYRGKAGFTIITPDVPSARGAQLSLLFLPVGSGTMQAVHGYLSQNGVIGDERQPDVIRLAPAPLYNTLKDCEHAAEVLENALAELQ